MTPSQVVYESPDGGHTVYSRQFGSTERQLHSVSHPKQLLMETAKRNRLWEDIHCAAENDAVLREMISQVEVYYHLKNLP